MSVDGGGGAFSLSSSSSNTMGFSTDPSFDESSNVVGEKGVSMPGLNIASMSNCEFSLLKSMSSRSVKRYLLVSKSLAPTLESTSSLSSCVPCWLEVIGTPARWLSEKSCLWDNSNCQASRGISCELIVIFWSRSFTAIVTESGPKWRVH